MAITLQAQQADGTWAVRNAFIVENARVIAGSMQASDLEAKARRIMAQWQSSYPDGKQLRVHNSDRTPPAKRSKSSDWSDDTVEMTDEELEELTAPPPGWPDEPEYIDHQVRAFDHARDHRKHAW